MLAFEYDRDGERILVHCDNIGIKKIIASLQKLECLDAPVDTQLMSREWGGDALDSDEKRVAGKIIHHVKIMKW